MNYIFTPEESFAYYDEFFKIVQDPGYKIRIHGEYDFTLDGLKKAQTDITGRGTSGKLVVRVV